MPRRPRLHVPGGIYHVVLRGNHRQRIFDTRGDRESGSRRSSVRSWRALARDYTPIAG